MAKSYKRTITLGLDYSDFTGGVQKCNAAMKKLDAEFAYANECLKKDGTESEKLSLKKEQLTQKINVQKQMVENAKKKYDNLAGSLGYAAKETEKADAELLKQRTTLERLENQLSSVDKELINVEFSAKENKETIEKLNTKFEYQTECLKKNGTESERLILKKKHLNEVINEQKEIVEAAKNKYLKLAETLGKSADETRNAYLEFVKANTELRKMENQAKDTEKAISNQLSPVVKACTAAFIALSAAQVKCTMDAAAWADTMITMSNNTGISLETLQTWTNAAELMDVSVETLNSAIPKMINNMDSARKGTGESAEAFKTLGLKVTDAHGNLKDAETMFYEVIDALQKVEDKTKRDAIAMDIFGESAQDLSGIISLGSEGINEYAKEFEKLGYTLSTEEVKKLGELDDAFQRVKLEMSAVGKEIAVNLAPAITDVFNAISKLNPAVLQGIVAVATAVTGFIAAVGALHKLYLGVKAASNMFIIFTDFLAGAGTVKILGFIALITALTAAIVVLVGKGKELKSIFSDMGNINPSVSGNNVRRVQQASAQYHATGTKYFSGGTTWVGEHGPELAEFPRGTRIYNSQESKAITNSPTYNVTVVADMSKIRSVQDVIDIITGIPQSNGTGGVVVV